MTKKIFILTLLPALMVVSPVLFEARMIFAQTKIGTTAAQFLTIGMGARPIAMGGAFVAEAQDVQALYWNPAGIARGLRSEATFTHTEWLLGTKIDYAALTVPLGNYGTFGASVTLFGSGDILRTTESDPEGTSGELYSANDLAIQLSYARRLTDRFAIGGGARFIRQSIYNESAQTVAVDVGVQFTTSLQRGLRIGATITNFGGTLQLDGKDLITSGSSDPGLNGANNTLTVKYQTDSWNLPLAFRVGVAYDAIQNESSRLTVAADGLNPSDDTETLNFGAEYAWRDTIFLRGGYSSLFAQDAEEGFTIGAGLKATLLGAAFKFDYTYQSFGKFNAPQWISVGLGF